MRENHRTRESGVTERQDDRHTIRENINRELESTCRKLCSTLRSTSCINTASDDGFMGSSFVAQYDESIEVHRDSKWKGCVMATYCVPRGNGGATMGARGMFVNAVRAVQKVHHEDIGLFTLDPLPLERNPLIWRMVHKRNHCDFSPF